MAALPSAHSRRRPSRLLIWPPPHIITTFAMRLASLLGITAAVTLAALAFVGSSADAGTVPSSLVDSATLDSDILSELAASGRLPPGFVTTPGEYTNFKQYSKLFTLEPHFAVFQPEGTRLQYEKDDQGRTSVIKAINDKNEVVSETSVMYHPESGQIINVFVENYSQSGDVMSDSAGITFEYDEKTKTVRNYRIFTPRGMSVTYDGRLRFVLPPVNTKIPLNLQPWDGKEIRIVPAPDVTDV
ncbi:hypothetical protein THASP1DRAFT_26221 [Thamnocephalis sphaerospora]|uniref:Uncharacterized protein n=1 Tax=Thamnocephalis sphaerospora TaxID=78915 RepID=A0A4V1IVU2_9FUNG|nr:hypothetical protein THASP1DRAFT_26221 [Thamnocephalis sphaerospora]|eukprot:RKP05249.1 hypothetical protein THASP1DRAFT_26221 [Thamnocephalis sphaerospora]